MIYQQIAPLIPADGGLEEMWKIWCGLVHNWLRKTEKTVMKIHKNSFRENALKVFLL